MRSLLVLFIVTFLAGCSVDNKARDLSCRAHYLYNTSGPNSAISAFEALGHEHNYIVANNLARYLILRGFRSGNKADFDRASMILKFIDMPEHPHQLIARYITLLKFVAISNGSNPKEKDASNFMNCGKSASVASAKCADTAASDVLNQGRINEGSESKDYTDLLAIYSRTHMKVFGSPFVLTLDDFGQAADPLSSCSRSGKESPGTTYTRAW